MINLVFRSPVVLNYGLSENELGGTLVEIITLSISVDIYILPVFFQKYPSYDMTERKK